jgi:ABC-2 type transport system permease protein
VRGALLLLRKDLRLLLRSPGMLALLVGYPLLVALLVAAALQGEQRKPVVAVVNQDAPGRTVQVGGERLGVDDYVARLRDDVDVELLDADRAARELQAGRVAAVLTIPEGFIGDLQSGVRQPTLNLVTSRRSPIEGEAITRRLEAAVFRLNQGLAQTYVRQVLRLVDFIVDGGSIGVFGRQGDVIGLRRSRDVIAEAQRTLRARGEGDVAARLAPLLTFIDETQANLDLTRPAATAISSPVKLEVSEGATGREPLSAFGVAGALLASLALAGVLLGAAGIASEREEETLVRLRRGLVPMPLLVLEKILVAALVCLVLGMVLLGAVALLTDLTVGRWALWPPVLALAGASFGAFGAVVGAAARETRTALLAALMLALPLLLVGLVPGDAVAAVASVVPFGPAFSLFRSLLADPTLPSLGRDAAVLAALAVALTAAAALVLRRRESA